MKHILEISEPTGVSTLQLTLSKGYLKNIIIKKDHKHIFLASLEEINPYLPLSYDLINLINALKIKEFRDDFLLNSQISRAYWSSSLSAKYICRRWALMVCPNIKLAYTVGEYLNFLHNIGKYPSKEILKLKKDFFKLLAPTMSSKEIQDFSDFLHIYPDF